MAIVKINALLNGIRGKFGGAVFSANKAANYIKPWVYPTYPRSTLQLAKQSNLALVREAWGGLNQAQIDAWNALAASPPELDYNSLGEQYFLSGAQWHARINMRRLETGQLIQNTAPPSISVAAPLTLTLTAYDTGYGARVDTFNYTTTDFVGAYAVLKCAVTLSGVAQTYSRSYSLIWEDTVPPAGPVTITTQLENALGYLQEGMKLFGLLYKQSSAGIRSLPTAATTLVLPAP